MKNISRYALVFAATGLLSATAAIAYAADGDPSVEQLQQDCTNAADTCTMENMRDKKDFLADKKQVGQTAWGCASGGGTQSIAWTDTTGTSTSVSATAEVSAGFGDVVQAGFSTTFGQEWSTEKSVSDTTTVNIEQGKVAWIVRATAMQSVVGDLSLWYPDRVAGHFNWRIDNLTVTGPSDQPSSVIILDRDMTAEEQTQVCGNNPGPGGNTSNLVQGDAGVVLTDTEMDLGSATNSTTVVESGLPEGAPSQGEPSAEPAG
jgi:hypothetical protein